MLGTWQLNVSSAYMNRKELPRTPRGGGEKRDNQDGC